MRFVLFAEGPADAPLVTVLAKLCQSLGVRDVEGELGDDDLNVGRKIADKVTALLDVDPEFDLLFIHMDGDNEGLDVRRGRIDEAMTQCEAPPPYVRVVPVRATESWLLVDEQAIRRTAGFPSGQAALDLPKRARVELVSNVKKRLREALARAQRPAKHAKGEPPPLNNFEYAKLRNQLLEELDVHGPVTALGSWQALVGDVEAALGELTSP